MPKNEDLESKVIEEAVEVKIDTNVQAETVDATQSDNKKVTDTSETVEKVVEENPKDNKVDEETVIEKIKDFLAKIAALQEESAKEVENEKKENSKTEKVEEKENKKVEEEKKPIYMLEYYDLPYRYNETVVKVLAQTPKKLFVYWDIADSDREKYIKAFGDDFYYKTYPVLLLYNEDKKYVREIAVNDFANSWYIDIQDPKTKYIIQLGRKFNNMPQVDFSKVEEQHIILRTDYLPIAESNMMEAPNDHILLESLPNYITFRNVKTGEETRIKLDRFKDAYGNNYDVKDFYNEHYKDEVSDEMFDMSNPSSKMNSSVFK